jgi:penicillin-binding protein 1A
MGNGSYGVQSASKMYFGKAVNEINLAEAALFSGIPNAPNTYNPYTEEGLVNAISRSHLVLDKMLALGFITQNEYDEAYSYELVIVPKEDMLIANRATSYFVDQVITDVIAKIAKEKNILPGIASSLVYNNGYMIYTTMDIDIQASRDEVFNDEIYFPVINLDTGLYINKDAEKYAEKPQAAMVIIDQYIGEVVAIYGGNGEKVGSRTYNRATQSLRQPGSSFKPIAIYGPAIDLKLLTAATIVDDTPVRLDPKNPEDLYPSNYTTGSYKGLTSIRNAVKASVNVIAARVFVEYLGRDNCVDYLQRVGIDRSDSIYDDSTVSVATGGLEVGVNPLLMASAFTAFGNNGIYIPDHTYRKVVDSKGNTVITFDDPFVEAYSEQAAFIITDILQEVTKPVNPRATTSTPTTITEYFIEGTEPNVFDYCEVHQKIPQCTSSVDLYNRFLLATEDCPPSSVINQIGIVRPKPYIPQDPYDPKVADMYLEIPVGEYCTVHGKFENKLPDNN